MDDNKKISNVALSLLMGLSLVAVSALTYFHNRGDLFDEMTYQVFVYAITALFFSTFTMRCFFSGEFAMRGAVISKKDRPGGYYVFTILFFLFSVLLVIVAIIKAFNLFSSV